MIKLKELLKKPTYSAVLLDDKSRNLLLSTYQSEIPDGWFTICHHMTIQFGKLVDKTGMPVQLKVVATGKDNRAFAVKVDGYPSANKIPHITIAINKDARPVDSNFIRDWTPIAGGIELSGTVENL